MSKLSDLRAVAESIVAQCQAAAATVCGSNSDYNLYLSVYPSRERPIFLDLKFRARATGQGKLHLSVEEAVGLRDWLNELLAEGPPTGRTGVTGPTGSFGGCQPEGDAFEEPAPTQPSFICRHCKEPLTEENLYCPRCGYFAEQLVGEEPTESTWTDEQLHQKCACGHERASHAKACGWCAVTDGKTPCGCGTFKQAEPDETTCAELLARCGEAVGFVVEYDSEWETVPLLVKHMAEHCRALLVIRSSLMESLDCKPTTQGIAERALAGLTHILGYQQPIADRSQPIDGQQTPTEEANPDAQ